MKFNRHKFGAVQTEIDGIKFASKAEAALYEHLKFTFLNEPIECQPKVYLTQARILYKPDFLVNGVYFEMKGFETAPFKIKKRLWAYYGPGNLHIFRMKHNKPNLEEIIFPLRADG